MAIEKKVAHILIRGKKTLAIAESCTGGLISHRLTNIPGSSKFLKASLVTYSNEAKTKLLKVSPQTLRTFGAVSPQTVETMARNVRKAFRTDFGLAVSGIAGPSGGTPTKPVGLVYIAISTNKITRSIKCAFKGNRSRIKRQSSTKALTLLNSHLK